MNARLEAPHLRSPYLLQMAERPPTAEALELLTRALMLCVPLETAQQMLGRSASEALWPSAIYYALARREAHRFIASAGAAVFVASEDGLEPAIEELQQLMHSQKAVSSRCFSHAVFQVLANAQLSDPVIFRRLIRELDVCAYRALAESTQRAEAEREG